MENTTTPSREERFKRAKELREKAQAEKNHGDFGSTEVPKFETVILNPNHSHVIRILGESLEGRKNPSDMLEIRKSLICDDDGKYFNVIWSDDENHPMNKLRKTILGKYKWDKETKTAIYDNKDLEVFKIWQTNRQFEKASKISNGMNPNRYILMNVIDRDDDWCKKNKHSKVLCWSSSKSTNKDGVEVEYPEYGVKPSLYNTVWDDKCTSAMVHFNDTDFIVRRLDKNTKIGGAKGDVYIQVCLPEEKSVIGVMERTDGCTYLDKVVEGDLTDEELKYGLYEFENVPFVSMPTPVGVIMKRLEKLIKLTDKTFSTNLWDEFVEWKKKELEEHNVKNEKLKETSEAVNEPTETPTENVDNSSKVSDNTESTDDELPTEVETKPIVKKVVKTVAPKFDVMSLKDELPELENMSEEDKSLIVGIGEDGSLKFKNGVATCPSCGNEIDENMMNCVFCGQDFEE